MIPVTVRVNIERDRLIRNTAICRGAFSRDRRMYRNLVYSSVKLIDYLLLFE